MSLLFGLRRVSQSLNTSIRHRHFTTQSPMATGRVVFFVAARDNQPHKPQLQYIYSAKIEKGGTLGPATTPSPIPFKKFAIGNFRCCNGLICFPEDGQVHILCPDTGEVSTLPQAPLIFPGKGKGGPYLEHIFGFDPLSNKHKVLLIQNVWYDDDIMKRLFWIFALGSGSWRQIHPVPPQQEFNLSIRYKSVSFANGAIHWIYDPYRFSLNEGSCLPKKWIMSFDMVEEQFRKIPYPEDSFPGYLAEFGGRLGLIEDLIFPRVSLPEKLQCWVLEEEDYNNHKWVKETIHLPFAWMEHNKLLAYNNNTGEMLLKTAELSGNETEVKCLLYYNTKTGIFRSTKIDKEKDYNLFAIDTTFGEGISG